MGIYNLELLRDALSGSTAPLDEIKELRGRNTGRSTRALVDTIEAAVYNPGTCVGLACHSSDHVHVQRTKIITTLRALQLPPAAYAVTLGSVDDARWSPAARLINDTGEGVIPEGARCVWLVISPITTVEL